jgi:hypothetical protein
MEIMPAVVSPPGAADNEHVPSSIYVIGVGYRQERTVFPAKDGPLLRIDVRELCGLCRMSWGLAKQHIGVQIPCPAKANSTMFVGCSPSRMGGDGDRDNFLMSEKY